MKTVYLREKKSGNFEVSNRKEATHTFKTKKDLVEFFDGKYDKKEHNGEMVSVRVSQPMTRGNIIKASYRLSQTYYRSGLEFYNSLK